MHHRWWPESAAEHGNAAFDSDAFDFIVDQPSSVAPLSENHHAPEPAPDPLGITSSDSLSGLLLVNGDGEVVPVLSQATGGGSSSGTGGATGGTTTTTGSA